MFDLPGDADIAAIATQVYEKGGILSAVCHGTVGASRSVSVFVCHGTIGASRSVYLSLCPGAAGASCSVYVCYGIVGASCFISLFVRLPSTVGTS